MESRIIAEVRVDEGKNRNRFGARRSPRSDGLGTTIPIHQQLPWVQEVHDLTAVCTKRSGRFRGGLIQWCIASEEVAMSFRFAAAEPGAAPPIPPPAVEMLP